MKRPGLKSVLFASALCMSLSGAVPAMAEMHEHGEARERQSCKMERSWKDSLTDDQKAQAERMHLALKKDMSMIRARSGVKKAELKKLLMQDNPDTKAIEQKISDITVLKKEMMQKRINHILAMRKALTPEQRVSFDAAMMSGPEGRWGRQGRD